MIFFVKEMIKFVSQMVIFRNLGDQNKMSHLLIAQTIKKNECAGMNPNQTYIGMPENAFERTVVHNVHACNTHESRGRARKKAKGRA